MDRKENAHAADMGAHKNDASSSNASKVKSSINYKELQPLNLTLPPAPKPVATHVPAKRTGNLIFTSGVLPLVNGELKFKGKLGQDLDTKDGYTAAKICLLNALSIIKNEIKDLDQIKQVVKVSGYVQSAQNFTEQPKVINGASELLNEVFGKTGQHAREAIGVNALPLNAAVELSIIVEV